MSTVVEPMETLAEVEHAPRRLGLYARAVLVGAVLLAYPGYRMWQGDGVGRDVPEVSADPDYVDTTLEIPEDVYTEEAAETTTTQEARDPMLLEIPGVPEDVSGFLARDTVVAFRDGGRCSGSLIYDDDGNAIGYASARHCLDEGMETTAAGTQELTNYPVEVSTGDSLDQLHTVGHADRFLIPQAPDGRAIDNTVGIFGDVDPAEVLAAYEAQQLPPEDLLALRTGDELFMSGWPIIQNNSREHLERQSFGMTFLGFDMIQDKEGADVLVLRALTTTTEDDFAECSGGTSGAQVFVRREVQNPDGTTGVRLLSAGTHHSSVNIDPNLNDGEDETEEQILERRTDFEAQFDVVFPANATRICNIAVDRVKAESAHLVFTQTAGPPTTSPTPTTSPATEQPIPGEPEQPVDPEQQKDRAATANAYANFLDQNVQHEYIDGYAQVTEAGTTTYVDSPFVFIDQQNQRVVLGSQSNGKDGIRLVPIDASDTHVQFFGKEGMAPDMDAIGLGYELAIALDESGLPYGLVDERRNEFGVPENMPPTDMGTVAYGIQPEGDQVTFTVTK